MNVETPQLNAELPTPKKRRKGLRRTFKIVGAIVLVAAGIAGWALNRYVIDHVKISDVKSYEAKVAATSTVPATVPATVKAPGPGANGTAAPTPEPAATASTAATAVLQPPGVTIKKVVTGTGNDTITYFVADVVLGDATELRSAFAENKYGDNIVANTSTIAKANNATFAINGDYYGYRRSGYLIRNGVVYRDVPARQGLAFYRDGTMKLYDEKTITTDELLAAGVWNTLSFGPGLVDGGEIPAGIDQVEVDTNIGNHPIQGKQPRTGLGMISANHLVFIAADGRSNGYSRGVTMPEFAQIFKDLGAQVAYNLDGGGSTTMYFNGAVVNLPLGRGNERGTSDILYIGPVS
jgi:exopolysaccharide biosynthesis protein